jgi:hypothetical protein
MKHNGWEDGNEALLPGVKEFWKLSRVVEAMPFDLANFLKSVPSLFIFFY